MLAPTGSTITAAISPGLASNSARTLSRSLYAAVRVSFVQPSGTPAEPGIPWVMSPDPASTSMASVWP